MALKITLKTFSVRSELLRMTDLINIRNIIQRIHFFVVYWIQDNFDWSLFFGSVVPEWSLFMVLKSTTSLPKKIDNNNMIDNVNNKNHFYPSLVRRECSSLTLSWWRSQSYRSKSNDFLCKSMDWFLYVSDLRHEKVKGYAPGFKRSWVVLVSDRFPLLNMQF